MTLTPLRSLLAAAHGPAVDRLADRSPLGVATAYLPGRFACRYPLSSGDVQVDLWEIWDEPDNVSLSLTDASTAHLLKVTLAIALGYDPGALGSGCALLPLESDDPAELHAWRLITCSGTVDFTEFDGGRSPSGDLRIVRVPGITRELNVAQALEMASAQVLAASAPLVPVEGWRSPTYPEGVFYPTGYKPIAEIGRDGIVWLAWSRCPEAADWMVGDNWRNTPEIPWPFQAANNGTASRDALKAALRGLGFGIVHNARR